MNRNFPSEQANVDAASVRYCLITLANLAVSAANHPLFLKERPLTKDTKENGPSSMLSGLAAFYEHRDIKCRQNAVLAIGNLCSNPANLEAIVAAGCVKILVTYAFPSMDNEVRAHSWPHCFCQN